MSDNDKTSTNAENANSTPIITTTDTTATATTPTAETTKPTETPPPTPTTVAEAATTANHTTHSNNGCAIGELEEQFKVFAKFGDSKSSGDSITLSNSDKWFKQAKVIDGKKVTTVDTGIYFKQIAKTRKSLNIKEYKQFLEKIATNKKIELHDITQKLSSSGPPACTKATTAANTGAVARLTDHTKYTGTHKQRFDEAGKGRGKAGRVDPKSDGYVKGYKEEGSYDKRMQEKDAAGH